MNNTLNRNEHTPMNTFLKLFFIAFLLLLNTRLFSQNDSALFSKETVFKNGIYITYEEFKNNNPGLTPENFSTYNPSVDFFGHPLSKKITRPKYKYPITADSTAIISVDSIFAFVVNHVPYIIYKPANSVFKLFLDFDETRKNMLLNFQAGMFFKMGNLSLLYFEDKSLKCKRDTGFAANFIIKAEDEYPTSPVMYDAHPRFGENTVRHANYESPMRPKKQMYILDFATGEFNKFNNTELAKILQRKDSELYTEYINFTADKQENMKFIYLIKFNERNPVYVPLRN